MSRLDIYYSPTVDRTVPKIPGKGKISLREGGGGVCKTASMTSRRSYLCDVGIGGEVR